MWHNRYLTGVMHGAALVPLAFAGAAFGAPVVEHDLHYGPDDGPQLSHHFNAGTASGLARPPGGYRHEQPVPKVPYWMVSPAFGADAEPSAPQTAPHPA
jgi:hypothetical protein